MPIVTHFCLTATGSDIKVSREHVATRVIPQKLFQTIFLVAEI